MLSKLLQHIRAHRLRTLVLCVAILALPSVWVAHGIHWKRQRKALSDKPGTVFIVPGFPTLLPWSLQVCGTPSVREVKVSDEFYTHRDLLWIRQLFPEALEIRLVSKSDQVWDVEPFTEQVRQRWEQRNSKP